MFGYSNLLFYLTYHVHMMREFSLPFLFQFFFPIIYLAVPQATAKIWIASINLCKMHFNRTRFLILTATSNGVWRQYKLKCVDLPYINILSHSHSISTNISPAGSIVSSIHMKIVDISEKCEIEEVIYILKGEIANNQAVCYAYFHLKREE